ncbi:MAG: GntR family transcriptional regulator [Verrucomicrobiae bacterium]|nr:GntR family transcriptional regulator [Verrucomicrobiae bacterium]
MRFHVNPSSGLPVYRQIMDQVRYFVASAVLKPGDKLPSIRSLARSLAVNPSTIVKAYTELEHEGTVVNKQGLGAFVAEASKRMTTREQNEALAQLARQLWVEAAQLGADPELVQEIIEHERRRIENEQ